MKNKIIAKSTIPIWYHYYGSRITDRIVEITVTEAENKMFEVKSTDGSSSLLSTKKDAMDLFNKMVASHKNI